MALPIPAGTCWVVIFLMLLPFPEMPAAAKEKSVSLSQKPSESAAVSNGLISIDFNNVDIAVLIKFISEISPEKIW